MMMEMNKNAQRRSSLAVRQKKKKNAVYEKRTPAAPVLTHYPNNPLPASV